MYGKPIEEIYQLVLECLGSDMTVRDWCQTKGISVKTYYNWRARLKRDGRFPIPSESEQPLQTSTVQDVVQVEILPQENPHGRVETEKTSLAEAVPSIIIETPGATFRFAGQVDPYLYERTLLLVGGRL